MERLQRILAHRGVASRRAAEEMILAGRVSVDGRVITELGTKADPLRSVIRVDGKPLRRQQSRYILLNKPRGYITTTKDERDRRTVLDLVQVRERVYPVGRLDRDTEGLLLLTTDGDVANRVMHPRYGLEKEYHVLTLSRPTDVTLQRVKAGLTIDGKRVVPREFRILRESREGLILKVVIHEGITHVVRRMMDEAGIPVERLRRVRIGPLSLTGISVGVWRDLTPGEFTTLVEALGLHDEDQPRRQPRRAPRAPSTSRRGGQRRDTSRGGPPDRKPAPIQGSRPHGAGDSQGAPSRERRQEQMGPPRERMAAQAHPDGDRRRTRNDRPPRAGEREPRVRTARVERRPGPPPPADRQDQRAAADPPRPRRRRGEPPAPGQRGRHDDAASDPRSQSQSQSQSRPQPRRGGRSATEPNRERGPGRETRDDRQKTGRAPAPDQTRARRPKDKATNRPFDRKVRKRDEDQSNQHGPGGRQAKRRNRKAQPVSKRHRD